MPMASRPRFYGLALAVATALVACALTACADGEPGPAVPSEEPSSAATASTSPTGGSTSAGPTATSTTETASTETRAEQAQRLATEQLTAYYAIGDELYGDPTKPLAVLDDFARESALTALKQGIQRRRDQGERTEGATAIVSTWLGEDGVVFSKSAPRAVVDLYVCYDISNIEIVDANGNRTPAAGPGVPAVAQARYAIYADEWPNDTAGAWRIGREFASGEACQR